ncbi:hypothetical protein MAP00_003929 [Monascus purpureus]|nr:hypothetical protein MAP00_003929 [Monascus purpureus]
MATAQATYAAETAVGRGDNPTVHTDISNYGEDDFGDKNAPLIKATTWQGKGSVKVGFIPDMKKGDILGHEFCGIVEQVGPEIKKVKIGQRVVASFSIGCGQCRFCKQKLSTACERTNGSTLENALYGKRTSGFFGYSHLTAGFAGGQAEYVRVPYGDFNLLHLPDDVPDEKGLYLSDTLCTSWHCVTDTGVEKGDVVAVWGAGPIGQMAAEFCLYHGASRVILIDGGEAAWRLDFVKSKKPKIETLDFTKLPKGESVSSQLKKMVQGGPDVCLDCTSGEYAKGWMHYFESLLGMETDTSEMLNEMIISIRPFGRIGVTGVYAGYTNHFNIGAVMQLGIRLIANGQCPVHRYWEHLLDLIRKGDIEPLDMVTHRVRLEEMAKLYDLFSKRKMGMQKVFVETRNSAAPTPGTPQLIEL